MLGGATHSGRGAGSTRGAAAALVAAVALLAGWRVDPVRAAELSGEAAFGDWRRDAPGVERRITAGDLPAPYAGKVAAHSPRVAEPPAGFAPKVPEGFTVARFASGLRGPRALLTAPNGDIFVAETRAGRVSVLRPKSGGSGVATQGVFASGLDGPFGMALYPAGADPQWLYVADTTSVVRFPYKSGDTKASGKPETMVKALPDGGHSTRGLAFTRDGRMLVSVGSASNVAEGMGSAPPKGPSSRATGAAWGFEARRADVLSFKPDGSDERIFATGLRNCVTVAVHPDTGDLWCTVNERDGLGDDLVPDYVSRVKEGDFFGWPWFYIGDHAEPRQKSAPPGLADKVRVPDVLLQAHSAALGLAFYQGAQFPAEYRGNAFVALHGSWNRSTPTGYKIVRVMTRDGVPTGAYQDFMTGLVAGDDLVYGRPVGVAVTREGALLVSDDGNGILWRISYRGS